MQNECTPKGIKHGCGIATRVLERLFYKMKTTWEKGQAWMSPEKLEDSSEYREGDGSGRYWKNCKEMDLITGCCGMWEREIEF